MRVLSFSYCFPSRAERTWGVFVEQRLAALAKHVELQVVSPSPWFPLASWMRESSGPVFESWHGLTVHRPKFLCIPKILKSLDGRLYARSLQGWLERFVKRWPPDLLDAHFAWPDGVGVSLLAKQLGIPYVVTLRGKIYPCLDAPYQRRQCGEALQDAALVISVDPRMAEIAQDLGVPANRVRVIPNGIDLNHFRISDKAAARRELDLPLDARLLLTVAHLGRRKGHYETIEALKGLPDDVCLVLVGGAGPLGGDAENLRKYAKSLGVEHRLIVAGEQAHERIPLFFQAADLSVLASWREGCPNVVLESLACGTPVVATNVGSVSTMIEDSIGDRGFSCDATHTSQRLIEPFDKKVAARFSSTNGRIVPVRNVNKLRNGIQDVLNDLPKPDRVRKTTAVRSWDAVADDVLQSFYGILNGQPLPNSLSDADSD